MKTWGFAINNVSYVKSFFFNNLVITSLFLLDKYNTPISDLELYTSSIISCVWVSLIVKSYWFESNFLIVSEKAETQKE